MRLGEKIRKVFGFDSIAYYELFRYLIGKLDRAQVIGLISYTRDEQAFEAMKWFHKINKSWSSKIYVFIRGAFVGLRVWLYEIERAIMSKISDHIDFFVVCGIFGMQILFQTALIFAIGDIEYSFWSFLLAFGIQIGLFTLACIFILLYTCAREMFGEPGY